MRSSDPTLPGPAATWRPGPVAIALGVLVALSSAFATDPLRDAATGVGVPFATLERPVAYLIGAPLFGLWDTLGLLSLSQHYAVLVTLVALYVSWRTRVGKRERTMALSGPMPIGTRVAGGTIRALLALVAVILIYVGGMLVPRPMAALRIAAPDVVTVDFHSHTGHSHDGWRLFSAARNRKWHAAAGFDATYVTDHYTWRGFDEAAALNPQRAGDGLVALEGVEIRIHDRPTNALGSRVRYLPALDSDSVFVDAEVLARAGDVRPPTLLYTMPGSLSQIVPLTPTEQSGVLGIEINDGSPRGLEQTRSERAAILSLADSLDLAIVSASNLHGWGRTSTGWSLLTIPGWRALAPEDLGEAIESQLHRDRREAVQVVERYLPYHDDSPFGVMMTLPVVTWHHFRVLNWGERTSWLVWLLLGPIIGASLVSGLRSRRDQSFRG